MGDPKTILFVVLGIVAAWFVATWMWLAQKKRGEISAVEKNPGENCSVENSAGARSFADNSSVADTPHTEQQHSTFHAIVASVCAFFDTLGIGCFAPTAAAFKLRGSVPDEKIPGTLNVGYAIPTIVQAFIYIETVDVDFLTLALMIGAAVLGSWLGAGFVAHWSRRRIQLGMGGALLVAATLMVMKQYKVLPAGGEALALEGVWLAVGLVANFVLGVLMTLGIGLYGPCMIVVSLLGMSPRTAFPIMAGSCAFLMPIGGLRLIREGSCSTQTAIVMTLSSIPAVLIAAFLVKEMPLEYVRWLVVIAVTYAAMMMLRSARSERLAGRVGESQSSNPKAQISMPNE